MITIHLWGYESTCQPSLISPESIALYWFLKEEGDRVSREDVEIVFSNNPSLSPNYHLPLLIDKQEGTVDPKDANDTFKKPATTTTTTILSGYDNITRYLTRASDDAMSSALLQFVADDVGSLTEWALYSNSSNFDGFTRGEHSRLLQCERRLFLGGASATSVRASVLKRLNTEEEGEEGETVTEEATTAPEDLAQSKVFKLRLENRRQRTKRELRDFTHKIAYLSRLVDAFRRWREATTTAASSSSSSFTVTTAARLLLRAHLRVQLSLPDTGDAARDRLSAEFSEEFVNGVLQGKSSSSSTTSVHHRAPLYWTETPNFVSSALNWCYYRWSQ